ncbi:LysR family transcriptional regulator [Zoogloea sp. LCSB751]|uniref:LysR family transcriptional regulator n=1 Tax=Zoogloea sp. LCSB751 TaxID=1965277 RepID=UPI0009A490E1|nr:LysR family transcriptional regulator [Zoogloea sp. LCSB751]
MNSDDLRLFARIVKAGSISRAALETGVDQSTLSRRLAALEGELGTRLLHRSGRGVLPTERGEKLLEYAESVGRLLDEAGSVMQGGDGRGPGQLHIAAQPTIASLLFVPLARLLKARYPDTRLRLVEGLADQLLDKLAGGDVDLALIYLPEQGVVQADVLLNEGLRLVLPVDHPLADEAVPVSALREVPLILPSTHHGLRLQVASLAARNGFVPQIAVELDGSIALIKRLVMEGCGGTLLPEAAIREELAAGTLKSCRLTDPEVHRQVGLVLARNRVVPDGLWDIVRLIKDEVARLVESGDWPDARLERG